MFILEIPVNADEKDFFNMIVNDNEGEAIQTLANGKALEFVKVSDDQKKSFCVALLSRDLTNRFIAAQVEKDVQTFREQRHKQMRGES